MSTALVTGGTGFIGGALCERFRWQGWRGVGLGRHAAPREPPFTVTEGLQQMVDWFISSGV